MYIINPLPENVPNQWQGRVYGVRIEADYPPSEWVKLSVSCNQFRTTQENYTKCLTEMRNALQRLHSGIDEKETLRVSFFTSK